jgi:hypothetical protein
LDSYVDDVACFDKLSRWFWKVSPENFMVQLYQMLTSIDLLATPSYFLRYWNYAQQSLINAQNDYRAWTYIVTGGDWI